jgi:hypothetical protein
MTMLTTAAIIRAGMWIIPLALSIYGRRPQTFAISLLFLAVNVLAINAWHLDYARVLAIPAQGGAAWLLTDRLIRIRREHGRSQQT